MKEIRAGYLPNMYLCFRGKYHKLKYGTEMNPEDLKPPTFDKDVKGKLWICIHFTPAL